MAAAERDRIRHLLALEAASVMRRLNERREQMVEIFAHRRDRDALVLPLRSTLDTIRFPDLARLTPREQRAVHGFHEALDDLHWYLRYTVDMPGALEQRFSHYLRALAQQHTALEQTLGKVSKVEVDADFPMQVPRRRKKKRVSGR